MPPMPTSYHLVIGTDHPFAAALMVSLCRTYGEDAVRTMNDAAELSSLAPSLPIDSIYLFSGIFPIAAEHPTATWHRSVRQLVAVLDFAKTRPVKVFWPSSISVFGTSAPAEQCPVDAPQETGSFYAIAKRAGEQWCRQYHQEHGIDVRCLRFPVLIRPATGNVIPEPDRMIVADQRRPVLHVEDAVRAILELMFAPPEAIRQRIYHVSGTSISVAELLTEIRFHHAAAGVEVWNLPEHPGPASLDDSAARADWGWKPRYDLLLLVKDLLQTR
jgi:nucleoside-diphosphate-sugar epimerase